MEFIDFRCFFRNVSCKTMFWGIFFFFLFFGKPCFGQEAALPISQTAHRQLCGQAGQQANIQSASPPVVRMASQSAQSANTTASRSTSYRSVSLIFKSIIFRFRCWQIFLKKSANIKEAPDLWRLAEKRFPKKKEN